MDGKTYYFFDNKHTARFETWIDGEMYYFDGSDCSMYTGWLTWLSDGTRSYFDPETGAAISGGWVEMDGKTYYFFDNKHTARFETWIDGEMYYFDGSDCSMYTGWLNWWGSNQRSYFGEDGRAYQYERWIDGKMYYFSPSNDCKTHLGWLRWYADGQYSYFSYSTGEMLFGEQKINGIIYNFGVSGKTSSYDSLKEEMAKNAQIYSSQTGYLILVDRGNHKVAVFSGSYSNWTLQYYWSCVTGAPSTPTIIGSYYTTGIKRSSLSTDSRAITCTQIWGGYFFHSILSSESELGNSLSHGCIRLSYSAAAWIYNNIYAGTRVIIYN